jgi:hypothetical protein
MIESPTTARRPFFSMEWTVLLRIKRPGKLAICNAPAQKSLFANVYPTICSTRAILPSMLAMAIVLMYVLNRVRVDNSDNFKNRNLVVFMVYGGLH